MKLLKAFLLMVILCCLIGLVGCADDDPVAGNTGSTGDTDSDPIQFSSGFECGNGINAVISGDDIEFDGENLEPYNDKLIGVWFYVRLDGVVGRSPKLKVNLWESVSLTRIRPVYSYDKITWYNVESSWEPTTAVMAFTLPTMSEDTVYVAKSIPFEYSELQRNIKIWELNEYVTVTSLGTSQQGREIYYIKIDDPSSTKSKVNIFITARVHPGETTTSYYANGLINWLINEADDAPDFRELATVHVMPMINPDGVYHGWDRKFMDGSDANRNFDAEDGPDLFDEPAETYLFHSIFDEINAADGIDFFMDMHNASMTIPNLMIHTEYFDPDLKSIFEAYLATYDIANFWYDDFAPATLSPGTANLKLSNGIYKQYGIVTLITEGLGFSANIAQNEEAGVVLGKAVIQSAADHFVADDL